MRETTVLADKNAILPETNDVPAGTDVAAAIAQRTLAQRGADYAGEVRRLLDAALDVMRRCGTESHPRVADIVATAGLSNDAFYRYFPSKDALLIAAMTEWTVQLRERVAQSPPRGRTAAEQLTDVLHRACHAMQRQPKLSKALVRALASPDAGVEEGSHQVQQQIAALGAGILTELDDDERADVLAVLGHVWYSTLVSWANGRTDFTTVTRELERAVNALLR